jgi:hypothetical protein
MFTSKEKVAWGFYCTDRETLSTKIAQTRYTQEMKER